MSDLFGISSDGLRAGALAEPQGKAGPAAGADFGDMLGASLDRVSRLQASAEQAVGDLTNGRPSDLHSTMIAVEKAGIELELVMQIRNKLLNAYETIMRQQI
jgi:flagellar hook-basal body complex protein FliE